MSLEHVQNRLEQRSLNFSPAELESIAAQYKQDTAVVLGKKVSDEGIQFGMVLIILIVRNMRPVTVMTRRPQRQPLDKRNFGVEKVVYRG